MTVGPRLPLRTALSVAAVTAYLVSLLWAGAAPAHAASLADAIESAVRITIHLVGRDGEVTAWGSGWTRRCDQLDDTRWHVVVATAGHVVDMEGLALEAELHAPFRIDIAIDYHDGKHYDVSHGALHMCRAFDYGEIDFDSAVSRQVLPVASALPWPGAPIVAIASPPDVANFGVFRGNFIVAAPSALTHAPQGALLASLFVAPGASGGPVLDEDGNVIATIIGFMHWTWGGQVAVLVALPDAPQMEPAAAVATDDFDWRLPLMMALAAIAGSGITMLVLPIFLRRPGVSLEMLHMAAFVCEKVATAVEQLHGDQPGANKKALALHMAQELLAALHLAVPQQLLEAAIEAAVLLVNTISKNTVYSYDNRGNLMPPEVH